MAEQAKMIVEGDWYECGDMRRLDRMDAGQVYLDPVGFRVVALSSTGYSDNLRVPLTPCDPPKEYVLGCNVMAAVDEEIRPRMTLEFRKAHKISNEEWLDDFLTPTKGPTSYCHFILSPPAPEPRSYKQVVEDIYKAWRTGNLASEMQNVERMLEDSETPDE